MNLKKGLMVTVGAIGLGLVAAWQLVKLPFRLAGVLWRHKLATALVAAAAWFGVGEIRATQNRRAHNRAEVRNMIEAERSRSVSSRGTLPKSKATSIAGQSVVRAPVQKNRAPNQDGYVSPAPTDYRYNSAAEAIMDKPLIDGIQPARAEWSSEKTGKKGKGLKGWIGQKTITKTVEERLEKITTDGVMLPSFKIMDTQIHLDRMRYKSAHWGACTIAVCQATNVQNAAVVRIGYISRYDKGPGRFQIYRSDFVSDKGYSPITEDINIALKGTNIRFGLHFDEKGVHQIPLVKGKPVIPVESRDGRELWVVREGHLERESNPQMVNLVLAQFTANRPADAYVQEYQAPTASVRRGKEFDF